RIRQGGCFRYRNGLGHAADSQSDIRSGDLVHSDQHIVLSDAFKTLLTGRDEVRARRQRYKAVQARRARNRVQLDSGGVVESRDFGAIDDRPRRIGDQAADAAPAGLGKRDRTRAENERTNRKKSPRRLANCVSAVHDLPPNKRRNGSLTPRSDLFCRGDRHSPSHSPLPHFFSRCCLARMQEKKLLLKRINTASAVVPCQEKIAALELPRPSGSFGGHQVRCSPSLCKEGDSSLICAPS